MSFSWTRRGGLLPALLASIVLVGCYRSHTREPDAAVDADVPRFEPQWTEITPSGEHPCSRYDHAAAYDPSRDAMWVIGGRRWFETCEGDRDGQGWVDVWRLELATGTWVRAGSLPHGVAACTSELISAVLDAERDRIVIPRACAPGPDYAEMDVGAPFGGVLDLATLTWRELPEPAAESVFAPDRARDRAIAPQLDGTSAIQTLDLASLAIGVELVVGAPVSRSPFVAADDRFFAIGGVGPYTASRGVVSALDPARWAWSSREGSLRAYSVAHAVWDPDRRRILAFGGSTGEAEAGTFVIDPDVVDGASEWLVPSPRGRDSATFVWDERRSRAVLFGGRETLGSRVYDDVWTLELVER